MRQLYYITEVAGFEGKYIGTKHFDLNYKLRIKAFKHVNTSELFKYV